MNTSELSRLRDEPYCHDRYSMTSDLCIRWVKAALDACFKLTTDEFKLTTVGNSVISTPIEWSDIYGAVVQPLRVLNLSHEPTTPEELDNLGESPFDDPGVILVAADTGESPHIWDVVLHVNGRGDTDIDRAEDMPILSEQHADCIARLINTVIGFKPL